MKRTNPASAARHEISADDDELLKKIKRVVERGNHAEVKRQTDGSLKVYEVTKSIQ